MPLRDQHLGEAHIVLETAKQCYALADEGKCLPQLALLVRRQCQIIERKADRPLHAELAKDRQAWLAVLAHSGTIALVACNIAERYQCEGHARPVANRAVERQSLFEQRRGTHEVTLLAQYQPELELVERKCQAG